MDVSKMRNKIAIEEDQGKTNDGYGNEITNWVVIANPWAEVKPLNGYEVTTAERKTAQVTHNVKIRYRPGIKKAGQRINFNGRILSIEYIINKDERNIELNIMCREG